jgi:hypothetical protein
MSRGGFIMPSITRQVIASAVLAACLATGAFAQGALRDKVTYTINVASAVEIGTYRLPAGRYILYQINTVDPNRFALYRNDMQDSPVAILHTARVEVPENRQGDGAAIALEIDESDTAATPVLKGWVIPGDSGYEIIRVDAPKGGLLRPNERD